MKEESKWISVEEALPEVDKHGNSDDLLVCGESEYANSESRTTIGWISNGNWVTFGEPLGNTFSKITHWQELPQPPKQ